MTGPASPDGVRSPAMTTPPPTEKIDLRWADVNAGVRRDLRPYPTPAGEQPPAVLRLAVGKGTARISLGLILDEDVTLQEALDLAVAKIDELLAERDRTPTLLEHLARRR